MPLYEYKCEKCGEIKEVIQKFSDFPLTRCGHCYGKLNKLISNNSFHLKGSGWYVTDYQSNPEKTSTTIPSSACSSKVDKQDNSASTSD